MSSSESVARVEAAVKAVADRRGQLRARAIEAMTIMDRLADDLDEIRESLSTITDPVTSERIFDFERQPLEQRGSALTITALGGHYAAVLEIHYEYGGRVVSGVKCGDENGERMERFYKQVFRGTPVRLGTQEGTAVFLRREASEGFDAATWLACFLDAVQHELPPVA